MASMPKTNTPLRPIVRRDIRAGDMVEWNYHPNHTQDGKVLEVTQGGRWASVKYGPEEYVTLIETVRLRILKASNGHYQASRDKKMRD